MTQTVASGETEDRVVQSASTEDELLTTADVAAMTRAPASTVRYWRYLGTGPRGFRIGRRVLYRRTEVMRWLAEQEAAATPNPLHRLRT
jgi:predicted DNA-binding transcriptional regulator AlpA